MSYIHPHDVEITIRGDGRVFTRYTLAAGDDLEEEVEWLASSQWEQEVTGYAATRTNNLPQLSQNLSSSGPLAWPLFKAACAGAVLALLAIVVQQNC